MENLYNVKISYKGEGGFNFILPNYGEITIQENRDIFLKGVTVSGVELLRELRVMGLDHKLNAKPDGCFKTIDLTMYTNDPLKYINPKSTTAIKVGNSLADLKANMKTGPITEEELAQNTVVTEESVVEEPTVETEIDVEEPVVKTEIKVEEPTVVIKRKPLTTKKGKKTSKK